MKARTHGLNEREIELVKLLMAECETTGDIQAKLKKLFAGTIEQMLEPGELIWMGRQVCAVQGQESCVCRSEENSRCGEP